MAILLPFNTQGGQSTEQGQLALDEAIKRLLDSLAQYSPQAAKADAQGAVNLEVAKHQQDILPQLARATEAAGTSGGSMQALLANQTLAESAQRGAAVGADLAARYGAVSAAILGDTAQVSKASSDLYAKLQADQAAAALESTKLQMDIIAKEEERRQQQNQFEQKRRDYQDQLQVLSGKPWWAH